MLLMFPSLKDQFHEVGGGTPVEVSVNWTANGIQPPVTFEVNETVGGKGVDGKIIYVSPLITWNDKLLSGVATKDTVFPDNVLIT